MPQKPESRDQEEAIAHELSAFLIKAREKAGLSQGGVAERSAIYGTGTQLDQKSVSRIEKDPLRADMIKIQAYLAAVGVPAEQFYSLLGQYSYLRTNNAMTHNPPNRVALQVQLALEKIKASADVVENSQAVQLETLNLQKHFQTARELIQGLNRKPILAIGGAFDSGKTVITNFLIGQNLLVSGYSPTTSVVNLLMHTEERPDHITSEVLFFSKGFLPQMLHDPEKVMEHLIAQGDVSLMQSMGTHDSEIEGSESPYMAIIFLDVDILKRITLMDTPGDFSTDEEDTEKALIGLSMADGLIFLSSAQGYMGSGELGLFANVLRYIPPADPENPLAHIICVITHCHEGVKDQDIDRIKGSIAKRITHPLNTLAFEQWQEGGFIEQLPPQNALVEQTVPFWLEKPEYTRELMNKIQNTMTHLITYQERITAQRIQQHTELLCKALQNTLAQLETRKSEQSLRLQEVEHQDARFREASEAIIHEFNQLIASCTRRSQKTKSRMRDFFDAKTSTENLTKLITDLYDDKKEAQKEIGGYVGQLLTSQLETTLKEDGEIFSKELESILSRWQKVVPQLNPDSVDTDIGEMNFDVNGFNARASFIGGLAGLSSLGAMSLYVSTIASNLGGYILVGKAAGVLTSLGLASGVTSVTSLVAAIGGPITIGIAIAALIGYLVYRLFGGSWEEALAKKVAEAIQKDNTWNKVEEPIEAFWNNTALAMEKGLSELIAETERHIDNLRRDAHREYDIEELNQAIQIVKESLNPLH